MNPGETLLLARELLPSSVIRAHQRENYTATKEGETQSQGRGAIVVIQYRVLRAAATGETGPVTHFPTRLLHENGKIILTVRVGKETFCIGADENPR